MRNVPAVAAYPHGKDGTEPSSVLILGPGLWVDFLDDEPATDDEPTAYEQGGEEF